MGFVHLTCILPVFFKWGLDGVLGYDLHLLDATLRLLGSHRVIPSRESDAKVAPQVRDLPRSATPLKPGRHLMRRPPMCLVITEAKVRAF